MRVVACACVGCGCGCLGYGIIILFFSLFSFVLFCVWWAVRLTDNKKPALGGRGVLCAGVAYFAWLGGVV